MPRTTHLSHAIAEGREANRIEGAWRLEEAKSRFSEVVRRARSEGPQRVTVRGRDAVVVIAADEFDRLVPPERAPMSFVAFMESLSGDGIDLTREPDVGRDIEL